MKGTPGIPLHLFSTVKQKRENDHGYEKEMSFLTLMILNIFIILLLLYNKDGVYNLVVISERKIKDKKMQAPASNALMPLYLR